MDREYRAKRLANNQEAQDLYLQEKKPCCCNQKLANKGVKFDKKCEDPKVKNGHTKGTLAAKSGCFSCVGHLMSMGNDPNASYNDNESTMLHYASLNGRPQIVRLLLQAGADVNRANKRSRTALHEAATTGHSEVVKILLKHKADVMAKNKYGRTTLHVATKYDNHDVINLLVEHRKQQLVKSLSRVTSTYPPGCQLVKNLVFLVVDFTCGVADQQDVCFCAQDLEDNDTRADQSIHGNEHGHTVATKAAVSGCVKCCAWLIRCGLDIDKPATDDGSSMLYCAVYKLRTACVQLLCEHGANVNKQNTRGRLPIRTAVKTGNSEIVKALCDHGADLSYIRQGTIHPKIADLVQFYQVTNRMIRDIRAWIHTPSTRGALLARVSFDLVQSEIRVRASEIINAKLQFHPIHPNVNIPRVWRKVEEFIIPLRLEFSERMKELEAIRAANPEPEENSEQSATSS